MKKNINLKFIWIFVAVISTLMACKKNNVAVDQSITPPAFARFNTADSIGTYFVKSTQDPYKLPIAITTVSNQDRTVQFTYESLTAVNGVQFDGPASITIPAGQVIDTLSITGLYAGYNGSRIDTVKVLISSDDIPASYYRPYFYIIMRKDCPVVLADLEGDYSNTTENSPWIGDYTYTAPTTATITQLTATTATLVVSNVYDYGWPDVTYTMDWTDALNKKVKVVAQSGLADGGGDVTDLRPFGGNANLGTFSSCDGTITLKMQARVNGGAWYTTPYIVYMVR